jgi:hypothetical protein
LISEKLANFYTHLEDKYFTVLDALDHKGIPVYTYSDFFEEKGIPSFIVTIAIVVMLLLLLSLVFVSPITTVDELTLTLRDTGGKSLNGVSLSVQSQNGEMLITNKTVGDGQVIQLVPQAPGTKLLLQASKTGYHDAEEEILVGESDAKGALLFTKDFVGINAIVGLADSETSSKVTNATVTLNWEDLEWTMNVDQNGIFRIGGVPEDTPILITVNAEGYTELKQTITFIAGVREDLTLTPSGNGFVGKANVIITLSDGTTSIDGATISVYNKQTGIEITNGVTEQGAIATQIQTGIPLRIVASAEGYLTYDSDSEDISFTLRRAEEKIDVIIAKGGESLLVNVLNDLGLGLDNAVVQLFYLNGNQIERKISKINGVEFSGLDPNDDIYITAVHDEHLPGRIKVSVGSTEIASIVLEKINSVNSTRIDLYTLDKYSKPISGAKIKVEEITDANKLPYGIDELETSIAGYANFVVEKNKTYEITAETKTHKGNKLVEIGDVVIDNKVYIAMSKKPNVIELNLIDPLGGSICGKGVISELSGEIIFDGNIVDSTIIFNSRDKEVVELAISLCDGNTFTENVYVKGRDVIEVVVYNKDSDLSPTIEYEGIENENGDNVQGLTPGAFFWARFSVKFPLAADNGGVHFRVGNDTTNFVDSGNIALYELDMSNSEKVYSYSYSENEVVDRSNTSSEGEESKWVEGTISNPKGTYIVKVKVRVADFTAGKIPIHYRAWSNLQDDYHRTPEDVDLGTGLNSETKSALYASTLTEEFNLYESLPECNDNVCIAMNFVDAEDVFYDTAGFEALQGKIYALEAEFSAKETDYLQVSVATDNNLSFIGTQNGTFNFVENLLTQGTSESTIAVSVTKDSMQKVRFYFIGEQPGGVNINFIASGNAYIQKDLSFTVVTEKKLLVELSDTLVTLGKNFTVKVFDEGLSGVENAFVKIINKQGEVVKSVSGNGEDGTGRGGSYRIENNLDAGLYTVEVSAPRFSTSTTTLLVSIAKVLDFKEEINVKMMVGQKTDIVTKPLENLSELSINQISYEIGDTDNFEISAVVPPILGAGQKNNVQINIEYVGSSETIDEIVEITIKGYVEGKFLVEATSMMNIVYNRQLDSDCLKLEPSNLTINLIGNAGSSDSDVIEATNNCDQAIMLTKRVKEKSNRSYIAVDSDDISLQPGQTKNITIRAQNLVERGMRLNENYNFEVIYDSNYLTKRLNVKVNLINPSFALSCPGQVTLWMTQNSVGQKATAAQPLYITNNSQFPIQNIGFNIQGTANGAKLSVEPSGAVNLEAGQTITPTKVLFAQGNSKLSEPIQQTVVVTGRMGNLNNRSGQRDLYGQYNNYYNGSGTYNSLTNYRPSVTNYTTSNNETLCTINATIYHSGFDCLKVNIVDDPTFNLSIEGLSKSRKISIQNNCAEPVRIISATSQAQGLLLGVQPTIVPPGPMVHTQLSVGSINPNMNLKGYPIFIQGITDISQTPIKSEAINIDVTSGDHSGKYSKATKGLTVKECVDGGEDTEITIDVPKLSSTDCSNGYCDAMQATEYIAKKLDTAIRKAESYAYSKQSQSETFGCETQGYCTFAQVGMKQESFELYLQNDVVSIGALREALGELTSNQTSGIRGGLSGGDYRIEVSDVSSETIQFLAASGYTIPTVFIDNDLQGCGYYKVRIDGAFPVAGNFLSFQTPVIIIRAMDLAEQGGLTTPECVDDIVNLANFTPIDKGFTATDNKGTWLTTINAETNLKSIGEGLAERHFKDKTRVTTTPQGNKIKISEGALTNALAEVCILGGEKKTIEVKVNSQVSGMSDTEKEAFHKSLSKMISDAMSGSFGNNCLVKSGEGHNCVRLSEASDVGRLKLDIPDKVMLFAKGGGCVYGDISSPIPESITFDIAGRDNEIKDFEGIKRITIEDVTNPNKTVTEETSEDETKTDEETDPSVDSKSRKYYYEIIFEGGDVTKPTSYPLQLTRNANSKDKRFMRDLKICAYPSLEKVEDSGESTYTTANGATFVVTAMNKSAGEARGTEDADGLIKINSGTLHPDDLVEILMQKKDKISKKGEKNPYYFTISWNNSINPIPSLKEYYKGMADSGLREEDVAEITKEGTKSNKATFNYEKEAKKKAITSYLGVCSATAAACNLTTGWGAVIAPVTDCVIPAAFMFKDDFASNYPAFKKTFAFLSEIPFIGIPFQTSQAKPYEPKSYAPALVAGGSTGGVARLYGAGSRLWGWNAGTASYLAGETDTIVKGKLITQLRSSFPNASDDAIEKVASDVATKFKDGVAKSGKDAYSSGLKRKNFKLLRDFGVVNEKDATKAIQKGINDVELKKVLLENSSASKSSTKITNMELLIGSEKGESISDIAGIKTRATTILDDPEVAFNTLGSTTQQQINSAKIISDKVSAQIDATPSLAGTGDMSISEAKSVVDDVLSTSGLSPTMEDEVRKEIYSQFKVKTDDFADAAKASRRFSSAADYTAAKDAATRIDVSELKSTIRSRANIAARRNAGEAIRSIDSSIDDIYEGVTKQMSKAAKEADVKLPTKGSTKFKNLIKSSRLWKELGRGVVCGVVSNYAGMYAYNRSARESTEELQKKITVLGDDPLLKGATYKMVLSEEDSKERIIPSYNMVDTDEEKAEMIKALSGKEKNLNGTLLVWDKSLHSKMPEERKLRLYLINIEPSQLRDVLSQNNDFFDDSDEIEDIIKMVQAPTTQELIYTYSHKESSRRISIDNAVYAREHWIGSLIVVLSDDYKESEKEKELLGKSTFLKNKITQLTQEVKGEANVSLTKEIAKKIFNTDPKKAEFFFRLVSAWEPFAESG